MVNWKDTPSGLVKKTLMRQGCDLHYWVGGPQDRPLIALMHGATMDHLMFNAQVEALLAEYRVLVWDARGHGESQLVGIFTLEICAYDMLAILDQEGCNKAVIAGQSLGGLIAQHIYRLASERVSALIIIDSTPIFKAFSAMEIFALKATMPLFNVWPYASFTRLVARSVSLREDVQKYALETIQQMNRKDFLTVWKAVSLAVDEKGVPDYQIRCPLLLVMGDHDTSGTIARDMPEWAALDSTSRFEMIPDAAHNANQDNPEVVNAAIINFLYDYLK